MPSQSTTLRPSLVAAAVASTLAFGSTSAFAAVSLVQGVVGGAYFTPPVFADTAAASSAASTVASVYAGAKVCFDLNGNGACDAGEPYTTTSSTGAFRLASSTLAPLVAEIGTSATNGGNPITSRNVFRVNVAQIQAATRSPILAATVNITPLSTEVALAIENQGLTYTQAVDNLAQRIGVSSADVLLPPTELVEASEITPILKESVIAQGRLQLAAKFVDRGDTVGELRGNFDCPNVASFDSTNADACSGSDLNTVAIPAAEEYAFNLEGMPQYDYVFVIIEENESQNAVIGASTLPYINSLVNAGNLLYNYFATGDPSEPNYLALGAADDWGQTGDEVLPYPGVQGVRPNLWNALDAAGLSWHVYEGSLWPSPAGTQANLAGATTWNASNGGLWFDNPAKSTIVGVDTVTYGSGLRAVKHNPAVWYADATAQPDFALNSRSVSGAYGTTDVNGNAIPYSYPSNTSSTKGSNYTSAGDWDSALQTYATSNNITSWWTGNTQPWTTDQLKADLQTGNVANYNFIVPDQDDDMHNPGTVPRADYWVQNVVTKIESSTLWHDPTKRVAIVFTFDEGEPQNATACCGWNPERTGDGKAQLVTFTSNGTETSSLSALPPYTEAWKGSNGTTTETFTPPAYSNGNHGHGVTVFSLYTNQMALGNVAGGNYDTDYYSHFSFVRSLQDIFGLADPGQPGSYMNRSKYTETFINQNATVLPEFAGSSNLHFDAVRAMNHVYQFPAGVARMSLPTTPGKGSVALPVSVGPDANQNNLWRTR